MIGNLQFSWAAGTFLACTLLAASGARADCTKMEAESAAGVGVHVRLTDEGKVDAIFSMGEGSFLAPKRSLINKARTAATLDAKRRFSQWLEEAVTGGNIATSLLEQVETTTENGSTAGIATEITQIGEAMASSTASVLNGLVKLDECVDVKENYILVELGWKPQLREAAKQVSGSSSNENEETIPRSSSSTIVPAEGYRKKSKLKDDF